MRKNYYDMETLIRESFEGFRVDRNLFSDPSYGYIIMSTTCVDSDNPIVTFISHPIKANTFVQNYEEDAFSTLREAFKHLGIE